jgi:hypothetical protein
MATAHKAITAVKNTNMVTSVLFHEKVVLRTLDNKKDHPRGERIVNMRKTKRTKPNMVPRWVHQLVMEILCFLTFGVFHG